MVRTRDFSTKEKRLACLEGMGIAFDAVTHRESVLFYQSQLEDYLVPSLELFWSGLTRSTITPKDVEREKNIIADECRRDAVDPSYAVFNHAMRLLWPKSGLASPVTGTEQNITKLKTKDIRNFCKERFSPEQAVYFAVGNKKELHAAQQFFTKKLSAIRAKKARIETAKPREIPANATCDRITLHKSANDDKHHANVGVYFKTDSIFNQQDRINLSFIKAYFAGSWIGRLIELLRIKHHMTYWVDADSEYFSDTGYIEFKFSVAPSSVKDGVAMVLRECSRLKRMTISNRELVPHKTSLIAAVVKNSNNPEHILSWYCQEPIAGADDLDMPMFISSISALTGEDIQRTARAYFTKENIAIVINGTKSANLKKQINTLIEKL